MTYADGSKYSGYWKNGTYHGGGTLTSPAAIKNTGTWEKGRSYGRYTQQFLNGETFTGEVYSNSGTKTFANGDSYTGEFKRNKFNGQGTYTHADGATYTGEWKDGEQVP